jgi:hypothetical protein
VCFVESDTEPFDGEKVGPASIADGVGGGLKRPVVGVPEEGPPIGSQSLGMKYCQEREMMTGAERTDVEAMTIFW